MVADIDAKNQDFDFTDRDFRDIVERVRVAAGIVLADSKRALVYSRVGRRLRALGLDSFSQYLKLLDGDDAEPERIALVNAITTNLTGFFREKHHFDMLADDILPQLARAPDQARRLRVWSAGCSSGEEPYTIAMVAAAALPDLKRWDARILATDIDTDMVATGRDGVYDIRKAEPIPPEFRRRYVQRIDADRIAMSPELQGMIRFRQLNLLGHWPMSGPFDVIFCRNVVIYFDKDTQRTLFDRFADMLRPGGWLFIGHSESLFRVSERFTHLGRTAYRRAK